MAHTYEDKALAQAEWREQYEARNTIGLAIAFLVVKYHGIPDEDIRQKFLAADKAEHEAWNRYSALIHADDEVPA